MATLTVNGIFRSGFSEPSFSALTVSAGGDEFANEGTTFILLKNLGGSARTVTIITPYTVDGLPLEEQIISVPATSTRFVGPFSPEAYNDANGNVQMTYDSDTSLFVYVMKEG